MHKILTRNFARQISNYLWGGSEGGCLTIHWICHPPTLAKTTQHDVKFRRHSLPFYGLLATLHDLLPLDDDLCAFGVRSLFLRCSSWRQQSQRTQGLSQHIYTYLASGNYRHFPEISESLLQFYSCTGRKCDWSRIIIWIHLGWNIPCWQGATMSVMRAMSSSSKVSNIGTLAKRAETNRTVGGRREGFEMIWSLQTQRW